MPGPLASAHAIKRAASIILGARALSLPDLVDELTRAGLALGDDATARVGDALDDDSRFLELDDGRWLCVSSMLDGTTWTTVVPEVLPAVDALVADPDLTLLTWWVLEEPIEIVGDVLGTLEGVELDDGADALLGPPGWLDHHRGAAMLIAIVDGRLSASRAEHITGPTPTQVEVLGVVFDRSADRDSLAGGFGADGPVELVRISLEDLLWEALVEDRDAFTSAPVPPVDRLLGAAGLERHDQTVAREGTDWGAFDRWRRRRQLASIHGLTDDQVDGAELVLGASYAVIAGAVDPLGSRDEEPRAAMRCAVCLADPEVARAFVGEHAERETSPAALAGFARRLLADLDDQSSVGPRWLLARALDHGGDPIAAQGELEMVVAWGAEYLPAVRDLAAFLSDRGDAAGAFALLRRAEVDDDDELLLEVGPYALERVRPAASRNELCPCGSGRKYKVCHLGRERHPLIDRGPWLYAKARRYLRDGRHRALVAELAVTISERSGRGMRFLLELLDSELVADVALCEAGVFDDFLAERDALLPDDEALLAAEWALIPRSLFEIDEVRHDELVLRDLRTGDRIRVTNTHGSDATRPGDLVLGRPLPIEGTWRAYSGFVRIFDSMRDDMLAALDESEPFGVAALIGRAFAPPVMQNTDGEPLVFHELTYRIPGAASAIEALTDGGLHDAGDETFTLVRDSANQPDTVILSVRVDRDQLIVSANSDQRALEARSLIARLVPDAILVDDDERDLDEMLADHRKLDDANPQPALEDPATIALLDELMQDRERRWIDEPVPALRGLTPREAAADPIGHVELERLLRGMDDQPGRPGGFDPNRIRTLLGLT